MNISEALNELHGERLLAQPLLVMARKSWHACDPELYVRESFSGGLKFRDGSVYKPNNDDLMASDWDLYDEKQCNKQDDDPFIALLASLIDVDLEESSGLAEILKFTIDPKMIIRVAQHLYKSKLGLNYYTKLKQLMFVLKEHYKLSIPEAKGIWPQNAVS